MIRRNIHCLISCNDPNDVLKLKSVLYSSVYLSVIKIFEFSLVFKINYPNYICFCRLFQKMSHSIYSSITLVIFLRFSWTVHICCPIIKIPLGWEKSSPQNNISSIVKEIRPEIHAAVEVLNIFNIGPLYNVQCAWTLLEYPHFSGEPTAFITIDYKIANMCSSFDENKHVYVG